MFHALTILWTRWGTALIWLARGGGANFCLNVFSSENKKEDACGDGKNGVWSFTPTTKSDVVRNAVSRNITLKLTITSSQLKKITCMWTNQNSKQSSSVSLQKSRLRFTIKPSGMFPSWISLHPDFKPCKTFFIFFIFYFLPARTLFINSHMISHVIFECVQSCYRKLQEIMWIKSYNSTLYKIQVEKYSQNLHNKLQ